MDISMRVILAIFQAQLMELRDLFWQINAIWLGHCSSLVIKVRFLNHFLWFDQFGWLVLTLSTNSGFASYYRHRPITESDPLYRSSTRQYVWWWWRPVVIMDLRTMAVEDNQPPLPRAMEGGWSRIRPSDIYGTTQCGNTSLIRRIQARDQMSSHLRERIAKAPMKWSRSKTELSFTSQRLGIKKSKSKEKDQGPNSSPWQSSLAYSYNQLSESSAQTQSRLMSSRNTSLPDPKGHPKDIPVHRNLKDLHKFLQTHPVHPAEHGPHLGKQRSPVMVNNPSRTSHHSIAALQKIMSMSCIPGAAYQDMRPTVLPALPNQPRKTSSSKCSSSTGDPKFLGEADSQEWTRRWVQNNPLGPERNVEYHNVQMYDSLRGGLPLEDSLPILASGDNSRKANFRMDKFLFWSCFMVSFHMSPVNIPGAHSLSPSFIIGQFHVLLVLLNS